MRMGGQQSRGWERCQHPQQQHENKNGRAGGSSWRVCHLSPKRAPNQPWVMPGQTVPILAAVRLCSLRPTVYGPASDVVLLVAGRWFCWSCSPRLPVSGLAQEPRLAADCLSASHSKHRTNTGGREHERRRKVALLCNQSEGGSVACNSGAAAVSQWQIPAAAQPPRTFQCPLDGPQD